MKRFRGKRKLFNKNMKMPAVLNNKIVLYIVLVVAIVYVLANISHNRFDEVGIFVLVAILSTYFSKNMIINLTIALVVSVIYGQSKNVMEGFKEGEKSKNRALTVICRVWRGVARGQSFLTMWTLGRARARAYTVKNIKL